MKSRRSTRTLPVSISFFVIGLQIQISRSISVKLSNWSENDFERIWTLTRDWKPKLQLEFIHWKYDKNFARSGFEDSEILQKPTENTLARAALLSPATKSLKVVP